MSVSCCASSEAKTFEAENAQLKKPLAETMLKNEMAREAVKRLMSALLRREFMHGMKPQGLSAWTALRLIRMCANSFRYHAPPDSDIVLRKKIVNRAVARIVVDATAMTMIYLNRSTTS